MSEAARADLYNGLSEMLGPERAETLMSYLPRYDPEKVATRSDIADVRAEIAALRTELKGEITGLRAELKGEISELGTLGTAQGTALLSLQRTLIAGFIAMFVGMAGVFFAVL